MCQFLSWEKIWEGWEEIWFTKSNPKTFLADGLPSADKLQALLALAAPAPEGAEEGIFGPDIFAGEWSDFSSSHVQSFNIFYPT